MPSFVENINKLASGLSGSLVDELSYIQTEISTLQNDKVDKVAGKQLSTEDYTTTEKTKLSTIAQDATKNKDDAYLIDRAHHTGIQSIDTIKESSTGKILTVDEREKLASLSVHPTKHPVSILDGSGNFSKFVKTDAIGGVGFDNVTWSDIQGKPSSFNPNAHQHTLSEISDAILKADKTYVDSGLAEKANTTDVNNALALKADLSIVATDAELQSAIITLQPLSQKGQANGYVPLDAAGKIPNSYLNSLSTIDVYTANSQANMLLLSNVNVGDQCIRTDLASNNLFILTQTPATDINNWKQINTSASVISVNGQTGVVNVSKSDVGLGSVDNTSDAIKNVLSATKLTTSRTISLSGDATGSASFDGSANTSMTVTVADNSHNHTLSNISDFPSTVSSTELGYLDGLTSNIQTQINGKQETLVSGTNVKTINGTSIVGSGDIVVGGGDMFKSTYDTTDNGIVDRAETADKLATARTIGGVSFNGTANIDLPGVNTTGNQNTTGNATTATTATNVNGGTVNATTGRFANDIIASQSITIGTGGNFSAGSIYSDSNWGMTFIAKQPSPNMAQFVWRNSELAELFRFNGTALTTNITGNSETSTALVGDETNWTAYRSRSVANMLGWKNYGNGHCIFDASAGTAPNGVAVNNTNSTSTWIPTHPTLMGWNGSQTFGVRVDSARVADYVTNSTGLGLGQTWQNLTASRALNTTYTNSTGNPIIVYVSLAVVSNANNNYFVINGSVVGYINQYNNGGYVGGGNIVVPAGATYSFASTGQTLQKWSELR